MITITEEDLKKALDQYGNIQRKRDLLSIQKADVMKQAIPPEIQAEIEAIDEEFKNKEDALDEEDKKARKILDTILEEYSKSLAFKNDDKVAVKSELNTVTFYPPEVEYDSKAIDGYALNHPELLGYRKEGKSKFRLTKNKL